MNTGTNICAEDCGALDTWPSRVKLKFVLLIPAQG